MSYIMDSQYFPIKVELPEDLTFELTEDEFTNPTEETEVKEAALNYLQNFYVKFGNEPEEVCLNYDDYMAKFNKRMPDGQPNSTYFPIKVRINNIVNTYIEGDDYLVDTIGQFSLSSTTTESVVITIPSTIKVNSYAFSNITNSFSIVLEEGTTTISDYAFANCTGLKEIILPNSLSIIGLLPFEGCTGLTYNTDENGNKYLGNENNEFIYLAKVSSVDITSFTFADGCKFIGDMAFQGCSKLKTLIIPEGIISIGADAFYRCDITTFSVPNSIKRFCLAGEMDRRTTLQSYSDGQGGEYFGNSENNFLVLAGVDNSLTTYKLADGCKVVLGIAFDGNETVESITIPDSVVSIDMLAFQSCTALKSITFEGEIEYIGQAAFGGCTSLENLVIPEGVKSFDLTGITNCSSLKSISFPSTIEEITFTSTTDSHTYTFLNNLESITVPEGNKYYSSNGNCLIEIANKKLIIGCANSVIPDDGSVILIGDSAFDGCLNLKEITIPDYVISLGSYCFADCENLESINISSNITYIPENIFYKCYSLKEVTIPEGVVEIGPWAFQSCSGLTKVIIPEGVASIDNFAFQSCSNLTQLTLPTTLLSIGKRAFNGCYGLSIVYNNSSLDFSSSNYGSIGDYAKEIVTSSNPQVGKIEVKDNVQYYVNETTGENIALAPSISKYSLTTATIREGTTGINQYAFYGCSNLTEVILPSSLESIGDYAFSSCSSLTEISLPSTLITIGNDAFSSCSSLGYNLDENGNKYLGNNTNKYLLFIAPSNTNITSITIEDGCKIIYASALSGCSSLTEITLPNTLITIEDSAFSRCRSLTEIIIPKGVISIGNDAFSDCSNLTSITILEGVTTIGNDAFSSCSSLTEISLPSTLITIGNNAFSSCSSLTEISLPSTLTSIGQAAFENCSGLTSIIIPEGVTSIGNSAFSYCSGLTSITLPSTLTSIGNSAFRNCTSLEAFHGTGNSYFTIDDNRALIINRTTLFAYAAGNTATSYSVPEGVTSIGVDAFYRCSGLTSISLPISLTSIGQSAFYRCSSLTEITINGNISTLESYAFSSCTNLTKLTLGANVKSIPSNLFTNSNLTNLTEIVVLGDLNSTTFPTGTWVKDGGSDTVTSFSGAGTYTKQVN